MTTIVSILILAGTAAAEPPTPATGRDRDAILDQFAGDFLTLPPTNDAKSGAAKETTLPRFAKVEVTQELYQAVIGVNPSRWMGPRNSVEMVSWDEANTFCEKVTQILRERKKIGPEDVVRLPTRREWEIACRAGTTTRYSFGDDPMRLRDFAWFEGNAAGNDPPVGAKKPNPWGLFDMHGYLWEWCSEIPSDGGPARTALGGAWTSPADECESDSHLDIPKSTRRPDLGFRCVVGKSGN